MPKKKGKGKGKKKDSGEGGLPPPPNIDEKRQGALEALLAYKITGKEDIIEQYEEESEDFREKNYKIKLENDYLKSKRKGHYNTMVKLADQQNNAVYSCSGVSKEDVEAAKADKMDFAHTLKLDLLNIEADIQLAEVQLEEEKEELKKWLYYKDVIQHQKAKQIDSIIDTMKQMKLDEEKTRVEVCEKLEVSKARVEQRAAYVIESEQRLVMEKMEANLDRDSKAELSDNSWLKEQIISVRYEVDALNLEVAQLEQRNLELIEKLRGLQTVSMEKTKEVYFASLGRKKDHQAGLQDSPGLPSLVDVSKATNDKMPGGQSGILEMSTLSVHGKTAPFNRPPDTLHLPPLHQQSSHSQIPGGTKWPISVTMLKSL